MNMQSIVFVFLSVMFVSGCSTAFNGYPEPVSYKEVTEKGKDSALLKESLEEYFNASGQLKGSGGNQKDIRDKFVTKRMIEIDEAYGRFKKKLYAEGVRVNAYSKWSTNFLEGVIPFVDNLDTAQGLSAFSLFVSNGKEVYDNAGLVNSTMPAIISEMDNQRARKRTDILERLKADVDSYSIYKAWADLSDYQMAGTIPDAIS